MTLPDRRRRQLADESADLLARIALHLGLVDGGLTVIDRIRQGMGGVPAQRFDGSRTTGVAADPTGTAAVSGIPDRSANLLGEVDRLVVRIHRMAERLTDILEAFPPARYADAALVADVDRANHTPPGCEVCAGVRDSLGRPTWSPLDVRRTGPTTVGGRLDREMWLCSWCADWTQTTGRLPNEGELATHHAGRRVPWPPDVPRPA